MSYRYCSVHQAGVGNRRIKFVQLIVDLIIKLSSQDFSEINLLSHTDDTPFIIYHFEPHAEIRVAVIQQAS